MKRSISTMNKKGHETIEWDTETVSEERIQEIEAEWSKLQSQGYIAADVTVKGEERISGQGEGFNPESDYVMIPRIMGGGPKRA